MLHFKRVEKKTTMINWSLYTNNLYIQKFSGRVLVFILSNCNVKSSCCKLFMKYIMLHLRVLKFENMVKWILIVSVTKKTLK